jgi:hypothetical protein
MQIYEINGSAVVISMMCILLTTVAYLLSVVNKSISPGIVGRGRIGPAVQLPLYSLRTGSPKDEAGNGGRPRRRQGIFDSFFAIKTYSYDEIPSYV